MKRVVLPQPPDPADQKFNGVPFLWQRAMFAWAVQAKQVLDDANRVNASPMGQQFQVGTYSTTTSVSGATAAGDLANFVATLVAAMTTTGYVAPVQKRTS